MIWTSALPPDLALSSCARVVALGTTLVCAEYLTHPRALADDALMSWAVSRLRIPTLTTGPIATALDPVLSERGIKTLLTVRLCLGLAILFFPSNPVLLLLAGLCAMLFNVSPAWTV